MMSVNNNTNSEAICFSDDIPKDRKVSKVVLVSFRLETLPSNIKPKRIEPPIFKVDEILPHERVVRVKRVPGRMERKLLIDNIQTMHHSVSVELISEPIVGGINTEEAISEESESHQQNYFEGG
jgi:hypothetical protein